MHPFFLSSLPLPSQMFLDFPLLSLARLSLLLILSVFSDTRNGVLCGESEHTLGSERYMRARRRVEFIRNRSPDVRVCKMLEHSAPCSHLCSSDPGLLLHAMWMPAVASEACFLTDLPWPCWCNTLGTFEGEASFGSSCRFKPDQMECARMAALCVFCVGCSELPDSLHWHWSWLWDTASLCLLQYSPSPWPGLQLHIYPLRLGPLCATLGLNVSIILVLSVLQFYILTETMF